MSFEDVSLWDVVVWSAFSSVITLIMAEIFHPYYGRVNLLINIKKFKELSLAIGIISLFLAVLYIITVMQTR